MELINFQGLNCYHNCIVSVANHFGAQYDAAFAALWSETEFRYDPYREVYLTRRMPAALEAQGAKFEMLLCASPEEAEENLSRFCEMEFVIVGMDAFFIPWNQFFQTFHGPHYFIAQYAKAESLCCFDPTYDKVNMRIACKDIVSHAFDTSRMRRVIESPPQIDKAAEAGEIMRKHPDTRQDLLAWIYGCAQGEWEKIILPAKYIDAMISNRYLYRHYLQKQSPSCDQQDRLWSRDFFSKWTAVKNGLYKAAAGKRKEAVILEVCEHLGSLLDEETEMAERMLGKGRET